MWECDFAQYAEVPDKASEVLPLDYETHRRNLSKIEIIQSLPKAQKPPNLAGNSIEGVLKSPHAITWS
jgi:hypothetical protein